MLLEYVGAGTTSASATVDDWVGSVVALGAVEVLGASLASGVLRVVL